MFLKTSFYARLICIGPCIQKPINWNKYLFCFQRNPALQNAVTKLEQVAW
jgi:hypothetical protein